MQAILGDTPLSPCGLFHRTAQAVYPDQLAMARWWNGETGMLRPAGSLPFGVTFPVSTPTVAVGTRTSPKSSLYPSLRKNFVLQARRNSDENSYFWLIEIVPYARGRNACINSSDSGLQDNDKALPTCGALHVATIVGRDSGLGFKGASREAESDSLELRRKRTKQEDRARTIRSYRHGGNPIRDDVEEAVIFTCQPAASATLHSRAICSQRRNP
jgi:hypothetical protein